MNSLNSQMIIYKRKINKDQRFNWIVHCIFEGSKKIVIFYDKFEFYIKIGDRIYIQKTGIKEN